MGGGWRRTVGGAPAPLRSPTRVGAGAAGGGIAPRATGIQDGKPLTVDADLVTPLFAKVNGATFRDNRQRIRIEAPLPRVRVRCQPEQRGPCEDNADRGTREDACSPLAVPRDGDGFVVSGCDAVDEHGSPFGAWVELSRHSIRPGAQRILKGVRTVPESDRVSRSCRRSEMSSRPTQAPTTTMRFRFHENSATTAGTTGFDTEEAVDIQKDLVGQ